MSSHPVDDPSKLFCLFCQKTITPIPIHGHMQCPSCGKNIQECCNGYNRFHSKGEENFGEKD